MDKSDVQQVAHTARLIFGNPPVLGALALLANGDTVPTPDLFSAHSTAKTKAQETSQNSRRIRQLIELGLVEVVSESRGRVPASVRIPPLLSPLIRSTLEHLTAVALPAPARVSGTVPELLDALGVPHRVEDGAVFVGCTLVADRDAELKLPELLERIRHLGLLS